VTTRVVLLNGPSSIGKSAVAKALQRIAVRPMLHVQMDSFIEMMPPGSFGNAEGYRFVTTVVDGKPVTAIESGPLMETVMNAMRHAIAAMAAAGADLIVDDVEWEPDILLEYRQLLAPYEFYAVALKAPLAVIEARELARGDRVPGLARWQYDRVHAGKVYDLEIDIGAMSPEEAAGRIKDAFGL
jgi:chloramphenicol 3-O phosphotransferase